MWFQRYRLLVVIYAIAILVGTREYLVSRTRGSLGGLGGCQASAASCFSISATPDATSDSAFWSQHSDMTNVVARLNPDDPDTDFLKAMQSLADGDEDEFFRLLEEAVAADIKHNDVLLEFYAQYLLARGADWRRVNLAVNRWRENHPSSAGTISLQLATGPRTPSERAVLQDALAPVPWIAAWQLESYTVNGDERWRVLLMFRPGETVDMRQAIAAVTVLSLTEEQRSLYEVTCATMQDCTLTRRPAR